MVHVLPLHIGGPELALVALASAIICAISAFGQADDRGGYDLVVQGMSGIPSLTGEPGGAPMKNGASVADLVAGQNAVQAILAALYRRECTGEGAWIDLAMLPAMAAM